MKVDIVDRQNNKVGTIELPDKIFGAKWNPDLVRQAVSVQLANRRRTLAHAKGRGEVRGGGRKPWRQKGTGRARHGSIRSPLWIGGGVTHGPLKEKIYAKKINKKMNRLAIFNVLSKKIKDDNLKILNDFGKDILKTKAMAEFLKNIIDRRAKYLLIPSSANKNLKKSISNIKNLNVIGPKSLNVYDLLNNKNIILEKAAVEEIEKRYI
jgi:large subunit ribosomal protein L4